MHRPTTEVIRCLLLSFMGRCVEVTTQSSWVQCECCYPVNTVIRSRISMWRPCVHGRFSSMIWTAGSLYSALTRLSNCSDWYQVRNHFFQEFKAIFKSFSKDGVVGVSSHATNDRNCFIKLIPRSIKTDHSGITLMGEVSLICFSCM